MRRASGFGRNGLRNNSYLVFMLQRLILFFLLQYLNTLFLELTLLCLFPYAELKNAACTFLTDVGHYSLKSEIL